MYDWLSDTGDDALHVVTANRRLARVLSEAYNEQQVAAGRRAWRTAPVYSYVVGLSRLVATGDPGSTPTRINSQQSRIIWERTIRGEVSDPLVNIGSLARQARDVWKRLHDWMIPHDEFASSASGRDQRIFARAASVYGSVLDANNWIDDAQLGQFLLRQFRESHLQLPARIILSGFDRTTPLFEAILDALSEQGTVVDQPPAGEAGEMRLFAYDDPDAELRAAGAWARAELERRSDQVIGIVVSGLEQDAGRTGRLIREGFVPGWQYEAATQAAAVNVSYGQRLSEYPAIQIALLILRWSHRELNGRDISLLLRSPFAGTGTIAGRARLELELRKSADRQWAPEAFIRALGGRDTSSDSTDWFVRMSKLAEIRKTLPRKASPAFWAQRVDEILDVFNWPGDNALDSDDFQLVNRWRDLLNDLARLELVSPWMTLADAYAELVSMSGDTVFQAETDTAVIHILGPLEAAGLMFDQLWVTGLTADQWPPARQPMALLSRRLQRDYSMPDADPLDTTAYALRVLERLSRSAQVCRFSYPMSTADAEQAPTTLIEPIIDDSAPADPGWYAVELKGTSGTALLDDDPVPPVLADEIVAGGAGTIQRQCSEPFAAFVSARLSVSRLQAIASGLSPMMRGNLVHNALAYLYEETPSQEGIRNWDEKETEIRIGDAVERAFRRYERHSDKVLAALLLLERRRTAALLAGVIGVDLERESFKVDGVEASVDANLGGVPLNLRIDRVDRFDDGTIAILDYKTGTPKRFLDSSGDPADMQLVVYACALADPVAALGLYNVDSRDIAIADAGRSSMDDESWADSLSRWTAAARQAAIELAHGDVRLRAWQSAQDARPLNLLSRFGELRHDS
jgi:probable DNA repair protein